VTSRSYFPQLGCQIALPFKENTDIKEQVNVAGLEYQVLFNAQVLTKLSFTRPRKFTSRTQGTQISKKLTT
jgi:hypothetical protein